MVLLEDFLKSLPKAKTKPPKDTAKAVYLDICRDSSRAYIVSDGQQWRGGAIIAESLFLTLQLRTMKMSLRTAM